MSATSMQGDTPRPDHETEPADHAPATPRPAENAPPAGKPDAIPEDDLEEVEEQPS